MVKTVKFKSPNYVGDPVNIVRIFNEKEVDELIFLDIAVRNDGQRIPYGLLQEIASECFMPFTYGGGINTVEDMASIFNLGVEKVAINTAALERPELITEGAQKFGSQSIVVSIDAKRDFWRNYRVYSAGAKIKHPYDPAEWAQKAEALGAGEILLTSIARDGTYDGYDLELISKITELVTIPVVCCGGAGHIDDFGLAVHEAGASAVAAGSMFVYQNSNQAVLTNFPDRKALDRILNKEKD